MGGLGVGHRQQARGLGRVGEQDRPLAELRDQLGALAEDRERSCVEEEHGVAGDEGRHLGHDRSRTLVIDAPRTDHHHIGVFDAGDQVRRSAETLDFRKR